MMSTPVSIRTARETYVLEPLNPGERLVLITTITNRSDETLSLVLCGSSALVRLERHSRGAWDVVYRPICPAMLLEPKKIAPGEVYKDTAYIDAIPGGSKFAYDELPAIFRAIYDVRWTWNPKTGGRLLDEIDRTSNQFVIER